MALTLLSAVSATNGKPEAKSTGTITCVTKANFADSDYCTIGDGTRRITCVTLANMTAGDYIYIDTGEKRVYYQLDKTGSDTSLGDTYVNVDLSSATTAAECATLIVAAINGTQHFNVLATDLGDGRLIVEHSNYSPSKALPAISVGEYVDNASFTTGLRSELFEFDTAGDGVTSGRVQVDISGATSAADCATILAAAINGLTAFRITALDNSDGTITVTRSNFLTAGNVTITENVANASFTVSGLTGGVLPVAGVPLGGNWHKQNKALLSVWSTAGYGTMTVTLRLWGREPASGRWMPIGVGTDSGKGVLNDGNAIGEVSANQICHCETVDNISAFAALYLEVTAITGTSTAISASLLPRGE